MVGLGDDGIIRYQIGNWHIGTLVTRSCYIFVIKIPMRLALSFEDTQFIAATSWTIKLTRAARSQTPNCRFQPRDRKLRLTSARPVPSAKWVKQVRQARWARLAVPKHLIKKVNMVALPCHRTLMQPNPEPHTLTLNCMNPFEGILRSPQPWYKELERLRFDPLTS